MKHTSKKINNILERLNTVNQLTCESDLVDGKVIERWHWNFDSLARFIDRGWVSEAKLEAADALEECIKDFKESEMKDVVIELLNDIINFGRIYTILQGSKENGSDNLDMNEHGVFTNKKEAMKEFNYLKHKTSGWCGDILVTELWMDCDEEEEYNFCPIASHEEAIK